MFPNSLWTPVKFTVSSFIPNCSCPSSSKHNEYAKNRFLSPLQARVHGPINLSLPSLDGWHWSVCHTIQMQYLRLVFSAGPIASSFTAETHPTDTGLSGVTTTGRTALSQLSTIPLYLWPRPLQTVWFHVFSISNSAILNFQ